MNRRDYFKTMISAGTIGALSGCISPPVDASFSYQPSNPAPGESIVFDASDSTADIYDWEFVDSEGNEISRSGEKVTIRTEPNETGVVLATLRAVSGSIAADAYSCSALGGGYGCAIEKTTKRVFIQSSSSEDSKDKLQVETEEVNISLTGDKTGISLDETAILQFSASNLIGNKELNIQLIIETPSGIAVTGSAFIESGGGQYTSTFILSPGESRSTRIQIVPSTPGNFTITGHAIYYFGNQTEDRQSHNANIPITVTS